MEVLVSGLNSYLGRASISYLQGEGYNVYGVSRDMGLLTYKSDAPITANVAAVDLVKRGKAYEDFQLASLDLSFYFTQIPDLHDKIAIGYELLSLRHFILLSQRNGCNRIIYVGRTYDKDYLDDIRALFAELGVVYTIVLKDVAVGHGTSFDRFVAKMSAYRYVFLFNPTGTVKFCPFVLDDIFRWIRTIPWKEAFANDEIEFGGAEVVDLKDFVVERARSLTGNKRYKVISIQSRRTARFLNRFVYDLRHDTYDDYVLNITKGNFADNSKWQSLFPFDFTPTRSFLDTGVALPGTVSSHVG